jgi:threonine/homoserine/homoserine lactone efflux protein
MLMTSGVKYGLGPTLPHMAGVILGFVLMIAVVGLGLDILFRRFRRSCRSCESPARFI